MTTPAMSSEVAMGRRMNGSEMFTARKDARSRFRLGLLAANSLFPFLRLAILSPRRRGAGRLRPAQLGRLRLFTVPADLHLGARLQFVLAVHDHRFTHREPLVDSVQRPSRSGSP